MRLSIQGFDNGKQQVKQRGGRDVSCHGRHSIRSNDGSVRILSWSKYSELEKRDLAEFPDISNYADSPAKFTGAVSSWFSDTEPYRDQLMTLSMSIRCAMKGNFMRKKRP